jgi:DNA-directed RNA polymerase specialized sigma24 family protein
MTTSEGTITRFLQLDLSGLSHEQIDEAVKVLCNRLFAGGKGEPANDEPAMYWRLVKFADRVFGDRGSEEHVADAMTKVIVELYPRGSLPTRNSVELEAFLRTVVRNQLITVFRRGRREQPLPVDVPDRADSDGDERRENEHDVDEVLRNFKEYLSRAIDDADERLLLANLLDMLYEREGAGAGENRDEILAQLNLSRAAFYRKKSKLIGEFLAFLDGQ